MNPLLMAWIIKQYPQDFIVKEELNIELSGSKYAVLLVKRINMDHGAMLNTISRLFRVNPRQISFCGIKDKRAIVQQYIAIPRNKAKGLPIKTTNLSIELAGFIDTPLNSSMIKHNYFKIKIRNAKQIIIPEKLIIPNYFDDQRFSENNIHIGYKLLKKDFVGAANMLGLNSLEDLRKLPKWRIKLYTNAVQSWIWNKALKRIIGDTNKYITINKERFPIPNELIVNTLEMPGYGMSNPTQELLEELSEHGLSIKDFVVRQIPYASIEAMNRETIIKPLLIRLDRDVLELKLPRGSYATIVVKTLEAQQN